MSTALKKLLGVLFIFYWLCPVYGASNPLFWKASKGEKTFYLLGTIHIGSDELYPLPESIHDALDMAQALFVEVDIRSLDKDAVAKKISELSDMSEQSLFELLDSETWFSLDNVLDKYQLQLVKMDHMQPWYFMYLLSGLPASRGAFDPELGVDLYLMDLADRKHVPVVSLETLEYQLKMFADWSLDDQVTLLEEALKSNDESMESLTQLHDAWRDGDEAALLEQEMSPSEAGGIMTQFWERIVDERNHSMFTYLLDDTAEFKTAFIAVGAMHMIGDEGLVQLLENEGYTITLLTEKKEEVTHD